MNWWELGRCWFIFEKIFYTWFPARITHFSAKTDRVKNRTANLTFTSCPRRLSRLRNEEKIIINHICGQTTMLQLRDHFRELAASHLTLPRWYLPIAISRRKSKRGDERKKKREEENPVCNAILLSQSPFLAQTISCLFWEENGLSLQSTTNVTLGYWLKY